MLCRPFAVSGTGGERWRATAKANEERLVLRGARGAATAHAARRSDWTKAMADAFVETLADTCNVTLAAAAIGRSISNVYQWRAKDASFRAAWDRALAMGYSRLELMLLERALHGVEKVVVARDGTSSGDARISRPRRADAAAGCTARPRRWPRKAIDGREHDEACERIIAKLERLKQRDAAAEASDAIETKGAGARLAVIRRALARCAAIRGGLKARAR